MLKIFQVVEREKPKKQAAIDFHEVKLCSRMFSLWTEFMRQEKRRRYSLVMKAVVFHRRLVINILLPTINSQHSRILQRKYFFMWMKYILLKDAIEKTAKNIDFLRSKVTLILPDYMPGREN